MLATTSAAARQLRTPRSPLATLRRLGNSSSSPNSSHSRTLYTLPPHRPSTALHHGSLSGTTTRIFSAVTSRTYSSEGGPNQYQVFHTFGTPFAQFVHTISRIARIITVSALGIVVLGLGGYEATHQYVEHVAMPRSSPSSSSLGSDDTWGWTDQLSEESWSGTGSSGTDRRLGIKGRHAVRSAWMCVHWGGGISPALVFGGAASGSSGVGRTAQSSIASTRALHVEDGMVLAMRYLTVGLEAARDRGIALPNIHTLRARLETSTAPVNVDSTALALETRMASIKERQGSRGATAGAIEGYERIFDILSLAPSTSTAAAQGKATSAHTARLARLANKIGDLNAAQGQKAEAERWLHKAVELAVDRDSGGGVRPIAEARGGANSPELASVKAANMVACSGWWSGWLSKGGSAGAARDAAGTPVAPASVAVIGESLPSPSSSLSPHDLTAATTTPTTPPLARSLLQSLVSLSALYAQRPTSWDRDATAAWKASLTHALDLQTSALDVAQHELERSTQQTGPLNEAAELHALSIRHLSSVLHLHRAETVYALESRFGTSKSGGGWSSSSVTPTTGDKTRYAQSLTNLVEAQKESTILLDRLTAIVGGAKAKGKTQAERSLVKRWTEQKGMNVFVSRLVRDAKRVKETAEELQRVLEKQA